MIRSGSHQRRFGRVQSRPRVLSWLAAILVLVASTAFAVRPTAGILAAVADLEHSHAEMTCAYAGHSHHDHHGSGTHEHGGHCQFCFAPALASGSLDLVRLPEPAFERSQNQRELETVPVALEHVGGVQSRAPPVS